MKQSNMPWRVRLTRGAGLALAVLSAAVLAPRPTGAQPAAPPAGAPSVEQLEQRYAELEAIDRALPRERFDPAAVLEGVGRDPAKLAAWVRDNTYWVPYQGALRGPVGVLNDRVGSSLDRALLLAELLRQAGHETRLAHATLADEVARAAIQKVKPLPSGWLGDQAAAGLAVGNMPPAEREAYERRQAEGAKRTGEDLKRADAQAQQLLAALGGTDAGAAARQIDEQSLAAARDHWWVQLKGKGEQWTDLDTLLPDGSAVAGGKTDKTLPTPAGGGTLGVPDDLAHRVDIRIVIEKLDGGKLSEHAVVTHTLRPAEVLDRQVMLTHVPVAWPKEMSDAAAKPADPARYLKAVRQTAEWIPVLYVGDGSLVDNSFTVTGDVNERPNLDETAKLGQSVGGMFGGFGGLGGGGGEAKKDDAAKPVLTAEWVEYVVHSPGRPDRAVRREVFDLIGPAQRQTPPAKLALDDTQRTNRGLALTAQTDVLLLPCHPAPEFVAHAAAQRVLGTRQRAARALREAPGKRRDVAIAAHAIGTTPLWAIAAARPGYGAAGRDVYLDTPNVFQFRRAARVGADGAALTGVALVDLAANPVAVRPGAAKEAFATRVRQGVADTVAESALLALDKKVAVANTSVILAEGKPSLAKATDAPTGVAADVAARVRAATADGAVVVAPAAPVQLAGAQRFGWWRVDPATGETIGVMDNGFHASATERAQLEARVNQLHYNPYNISLSDIKSGQLAKDQFIDIMLNGRGLQGLQLMRAFQKAAQLYDLLVLL